MLLLLYEAQYQSIPCILPAPCERKDPFIPWLAFCLAKNLPPTQVICTNRSYLWEQKILSGGNIQQKPGIAHVWGRLAGKGRRADFFFQLLWRRGRLGKRLLLKQGTFKNVCVPSEMMKCFICWVLKLTPSRSVSPLAISSPIKYSPISPSHVPSPWAQDPDSWCTRISEPAAPRWDIICLWGYKNDRSVKMTGCPCGQPCGVLVVATSPAAPSVMPEVLLGREGQKQPSACPQLPACQVKDVKKTPGWRFPFPLLPGHGQPHRERLCYTPALVFFFLAPAVNPVPLSCSSLSLPATADTLPSGWQHLALFVAMRGFWNNTADKEIKFGGVWVD